MTNNSLKQIKFIDLRYDNDINQSLGLFTKPSYILREMTCSSNQLN